MAIAKLTIDLEARLAGLEQGLEKANFLAGKNAALIEARYSKLAGTFKTAGIAIASVFTLDKIRTFLNATIDSIDALNDMRDATGATIENLSALEAIANRTGTSTETLTDAIVKMNLALINATPGSQVAQIIERIGLNVKELLRLDPAEAFRRLAGAFGKYADDGDKARLFTILFGKSLKDISPLMHDLEGVSQLVAKRTQEDADAADKFNKSLFTLQSRIKGVSQSLAGGLIKGLNETFDAMQKAGGFFDAFAALFKFEGKSIGLNRLSVQIRDAVKEAQDLQKYLDFTREKGIQPTPGTIEQLERVRKKIDELQRKSAAAHDDLREFANLIAPIEKKAQTIEKPSVGGVPKTRTSGSKKAEEISDARRALASYVEQLSKEIEKSKELTNVQQALNFLRSQGAAGEVEQVRTLVLALAKKKDALERSLALEKGIAEQMAKQKEIDDQLEQFSGRTADKLKIAQVSRLEERLKENPTLFTQSELEKIVKGIAGISEEANKSTEAFDAFSTALSSSIESSIFKVGSLNDVFESLIGTLSRLAAKKLIIDPVISRATPIFNNIASFLGLKDGGLFSSGVLQKYASGGIFGVGGGLVSRPTVFPMANGVGLAGEAGTEAVLPLKRSASGKLGVIAKGGAGLTINQTINVDSRTDRASITQAIADASKQSQLQMYRDLRAMGAI